MKTWAIAMRRFWARWGFYVLTAVCLVLIAGAAVYARRRVASPSGASGLAASPAVPAAILATAQPEAAVVAPAGTPAPALLWPVSGRVVLRDNQDQPIWFEPLGLYETHPGVDIAAAQGETVLAAADGVVARAGFDPQRGYMVETDGEGGLVLRYGNLSKDYQVSPGDRVRRGQEIGKVGASAPSAGVMGPFLHFEAFRGGTWVALP